MGRSVLHDVIITLVVSALLIWLLPLMISTYTLTVLVIYGMLGLGLAMQTTGTADLLASALLRVAVQMAVFRVLLNVLVIALLPLDGGLPEAYALSLRSGYEYDTNQVRFSTITSEQKSGHYEKSRRSTPVTRHLITSQDVFCCLPRIVRL